MAVRTFGVRIQKMFFFFSLSVCLSQFFQYFKLKGPMPSVVAHKYYPRPLRGGGRMIKAIDIGYLLSEFKASLATLETLSQK